MTIKTKVQLKVIVNNEEIKIPKGTTGMIKAVSTSLAIKTAFKNLKLDKWFYICRFPMYVDETLCDLSQIEII